MSVRTRLFLLLTGLLLCLSGAQWWLQVRQNHLLEEAMSRTAFTVSTDTLEVVLMSGLGYFSGMSDNASSANEATENASSEPPLDVRLVDNGHNAAVVLNGPYGEQRIAISRQALDETMNVWRHRQYVFTAAIVCVGLLLAAIIAYGFARPLQRLQQVAHKMAQGSLGLQVAAAPGAPTEVQELISAFNRMSAELAKLDADNRQLRAADAANELADLARGLAHTLRNPLNTLGLSIDEMSRADLSESGREQMAQMSRRQIQKIDHWLRALLDVTQQDEHLPLRLDIGQLAIELTQEFSDSLMAITVRVESDSPFLCGHAREIGSLLHGLLSNAVEASQPGDAITVRIRGQEGDLSIVVEDSGKGLSDSVRARLFQPHVTDKSNGAGMGLFLAQRIARGRYRGDLILSPHQMMDEQGVVQQRGTVACLQLRSRSSS